MNVQALAFTTLNWCVVVVGRVLVLEGGNAPAVSDSSKPPPQRTIQNYILASSRPCRPRGVAFSLHGLRKSKAHEAPRVVAFRTRKNVLPQKRKTKSQASMCLLCYTFIAFLCVSLFLYAFMALSPFLFNQTIPN